MAVKSPGWSGGVVEGWRWRWAAGRITEVKRSSQIKPQRWRGNLETQITPTQVGHKTYQKWRCWNGLGDQNAHQWCELRREAINTTCLTLQITLLSTGHLPPESWMWSLHTWIHPASLTFIFKMTQKLYNRVFLMDATGSMVTKPTQ